jgi:hypothetical protein
VKAFLRVDASKGELAMTRILAILIVTIGVTTAQSAVASQSAESPRFSEVAYGGRFSMSCYVNGVTYPVDGAFNVWASNGFGNWFIIGQLVNNGNGYYIVRTDGVTFAASCY